MKLYDEEELRIKNEKNKRMKNLILVSIIFTVVMIVLLMGGIYYLIYNPDKITIKLNGEEDEEIENMLLTKTADDGSTIVYFPIRQISTKFNYTSNNGDYGRNVENTENCFVESKDEVAIFTENSNIIYKIDKTNEDNTFDYEYEEVIIDNFVIKENDKLYIDTKGLEKAFNLYINTNSKMKKINIIPLDKLIASAENIVKNKKLGKLDEKFANKKAILDNMIVIESDNNGKKGVINYSTKEEILGFQYDDITYIPSKQSFLIKKEDKVGIIGSDRIVKIKPQYSELTLIDSERGLYLAREDINYGIIDENGNAQIYLEYSKIGVDINEYKDNGLKNGYVLLGKLIPVQKDGKWMFYKIESSQNRDGSKNVQCIKLDTEDYEEIGCISKVTRGTVSNLMVIDEYDVVLVKKNDSYGFINTDGEHKSSLIYKDAFIETNSGKKDYFAIDTSGNLIRVVEELEKNGAQKRNN